MEKCYHTIVEGKSNKRRIDSDARDRNCLINEEVNKIQSVSSNSNLSYILVGELNLSICLVRRLRSTINRFLFSKMLWSDLYSWSGISKYDINYYLKLGFVERVAISQISCQKFDIYYEVTTFCQFEKKLEHFSSWLLTMK